MKVQIEVTHKKSEKGPKYKRRQIDRGPTDRHINVLRERQTDKERKDRKIDRRSRQAE